MQIIRNAKLLVGIALALGLNLPINIPTVYAAPPKLKVVGNQFQDPAGSSVVIRGVSITDFQHVEEAYGYKFMIDLLTNEQEGWYTKVLRVPVHPNVWHGSNRDEMFNRYLKPLVNYATEKGLYVIIDWHYIADPRNHQQETLEFWNYIAPKFASYDNVFYELFNELRGNANDIGLNWQVWKGVAQPWVNAIRAAGAPNILLMCGPQYCQHMREAGADPFYDPITVEHLWKPTIFVSYPTCPTEFIFIDIFFKWLAKTFNISCNFSIFVIAVPAPLSNHDGESVIHRL